jgi:lactoylglutathione lyase
VGQKPLGETEDVTTTDVETYRMNHTMIRVKDAEKSLSFYQDVMGMKLIRTVEAKPAGFNLYFLGYDDPQSSTAHKEGLLELTWNYGTEKDPDFKYHDGNAEPQGFGHICVSVDDIKAACDRFEEKGVS